MLASAGNDEFITKLVAPMIEAVGTLNTPGAPTPLGVLTVQKIKEDVVTAVVDTVTDEEVPGTRVAVPILAFEPVATNNLLPALKSFRFPWQLFVPVKVFVPLVEPILTATVLAPPVQILIVWLLLLVTVQIFTVLFPVPEPRVIPNELLAVPTLIVFVPIVTEPLFVLAPIFMVVAPDPIPKSTVFVLLDAPMVIVPVCAVPPIVIVPLVVAAPI